MNKRFHKRAITAATAVMTLTTVVTSVDAAAKNEITIGADRGTVAAGESFDLAVGLTPDGTGISGFTVDLHYDTDAVTLNIPDESEYSPDSKFALVTNFEYADGVVRIVGGNLSGTNVKVQTLIADLDFTVKDGYSGDVGFWTEVQDLVYTDGEEFVNAEFTAFGEYTQYIITAEAPVTTTVPETAPTTTEPETTPEPETQPEETQTEAEPELPETFIPPETVIIPEPAPAPETVIPDEPAPEEDTGESEEQPADPQTEQPTDPQTEQPAADGEAIFEYKQGDTDFYGETVQQYIFSPADYTEETSDTVDIEVTVESDGSASGGIGMQTEEGWLIYSENADGSGETVWTADDVDLSGVSGDIAVQLYYLERDSSFKIRGITISSNGQQASNDDTAVPEDTDTDTDTNTDTDTADGEQTGGEDTYTDGSDYTQPEDTDTDEHQPADDGASGEENAAPEEDTDSAETEQEQTETEAPAAEAPAAEAPADTESEAETTTTAAAPAAAPSTSSTSAAPSSSPSNSDGNPLTGDGFLSGHALPFGIIALCLAQIGYSSFRLTRKEQ